MVKIVKNLLPHRPKYTDELDRWWWVPRVHPKHADTWSKGILAGTVAGLSLMTAGGVWLTSGPYSSAIDMNAPAMTGGVDVTRAVPATRDNGSYGALSAGKIPNAATKGTTGFLSSRTSSITRSESRKSLNAALTEHEAQQRTVVLHDINDNVQEAATNAGVKLRTEAITVDFQKVKAEQSRIQKEQATAKKRLGKLDNGYSNGAGSDSKGAGMRELGRGGSTPLPKGSYSVGAFWGQYGAWSRWHTGQDLPAPIGTRVLATADGVVSTRCAGCQGWAGDSVIVLHHADGSSTLYAHMGSATVSNGEIVRSGQTIGYVGMKGRTFGPHLHFEHYPAGSVPGDVYSTDNPVRWLLGQGVHL